MPSSKTRETAAILWISYAICSRDCAARLLSFVHSASSFAAGPTDYSSSLSMLPPSTPSNLSISRAWRVALGSLRITYLCPLLLAEPPFSFFSIILEAYLVTPYLFNPTTWMRNIKRRQVRPRAHLHLLLMKATRDQPSGPSRLVCGTASSATQMPQLPSQALSAQMARSLM